MNWKTYGLIGCILLTTAFVRAEEYRVQAQNEPPPADELSEAVAARMSAKGWKVIEGEDRVVCELWLCKELPVKADFTANAEVLYPFQQGQLIGALRFPRRSRDFRDQNIARGVYTLRYGLQPIDGNHVGTSPTRDFLLLVRAADDRSADDLDVKTLMSASADAAGSNHPGMLCLQRVQGEPAAAPALREVPNNEWWILQITGAANAGGKSQPLPIAMVVVGHASE